MVKGKIIFSDDGGELEFVASYTKLRDGWFCIHYEKKDTEENYRQEFWPAHAIEKVIQHSDQASDKRNEERRH